MKTTNSHCQSCGMPMKRDAQGGGSNADGSCSALYCSHCYQHGQFTLPDLTAVQMQARVREKMRDMRIPGFVAYFFVRGIPKLARWAGR